MMRRKSIMIPGGLYPYPVPGLRPRFALKRSQLHLTPHTPDLMGEIRCRTRAGHQSIVWDLKLSAFTAIVRPDLPDLPLDPLSARVFEIAKELNGLYSGPGDARQERAADAAWSEICLALAMRGERRIFASDRPFGSSRGLGTMVLAIAPAAYEGCDITVLEG